MKKRLTSEEEFLIEFGRFMLALIIVVGVILLFSSLESIIDFIVDML